MVQDKFVPVINPRKGNMLTRGRAIRLAVIAALIVVSLLALRAPTASPATGTTAVKASCPLVQETKVVGLTMAFHWQCRVVQAESVTLNGDAESLTSFTAAVKCPGYAVRVMSTVKVEGPFTYVINKANHPETYLLLHASAACRVGVVMVPKGYLLSVSYTKRA